jgi:hypothetical protein
MVDFDYDVFVHACLSPSCAYVEEKKDFGCRTDGIRLSCDGLPLKSLFCSVCARKVASALYKCLRWGACPFF